MITRPLDLSSRLRPRPRNFDFLFLVNGGLIVLFFGLFGSRFVLSPGLRVNGEAPRIPVDSRAIVNAAATSASVSVNASGQIFVDTGRVATIERLKEWLEVQARRAPGTVLLVIVDGRVPTDTVSTISSAATAAGFAGVQIAMQPGTAPEGGMP